MAYDEILLDRIRKVTGKLEDILEKKMFGGVAFMLNGNMAFGIHNKDLIVRVGPDNYEDALNNKNVKIMDFTGRPMKGFVIVLPAGIKSEIRLKYWINRGIEFAGKLTPK